MRAWFIVYGWPQLGREVSAVAAALMGGSCRLILFVGECQPSCIAKLCRGAQLRTLQIIEILARHPGIFAIFTSATCGKVVAKETEDR